MISSSNKQKTPHKAGFFFRTELKPAAELQRL